MSAKRTTGFGVPKPLPGQPGYKMSESTALEKEAKEMELRLQILQDRLAQQQQETEKTQKASSNGLRWKSSNPEKGTVRSYGKEVTEKFKVKTQERESARNKLLFDVSTFNDDQPPPLPPKKVSPTNYPSESPAVKDISYTNHSFSSKDVITWSTYDVGDWLTHLQMPQYQEIFRMNEINGELLIDMTLDDLDYLNITVLGHRKTIMKAIEEIRRQLKSNGFAVRQNLAPSSLQRGNSASSTFHKYNDSAVIPVSIEKPTAQEGKPVHWSQLEPLSSKQVKGGVHAINAADDNILDEEAERLAFMQAVEEWRKGDSAVTKTVTIVREFERKHPPDVSNLQINVSGSDTVSDGMWRNPFASDSTNMPSSLWDGHLDEEHERAEFKKAVEAWRTSSSSKESGSSLPSTIQTSATESVYAGESSLVSAKTVAESLAKKMEEEQNEVVKKIQKQKLDAERRLLQANQELQQLRLVKEHTFDPTVLTSNVDEDDFKFTYSKGPLEMQVSFNDSDNDEPALRITDSKDISSKGDGRPQLPSTVKISLVESLIGTPVHVLEDDDGAVCVVEYDSDES